jgi:hypothetical protein
VPSYLPASRLSPWYGSQDPECTTFSSATLQVDMRSVEEDLGLAGYDTVLIGKELQMFRKTVLLLF